MRGNPGEFEKPNKRNDRGMRGNQMTVEWEGNEGKPNELGNDRGMRGEMRGNRMRGMRGNRMRGMRGMIVEWKGNEENLWETGMRGEWQRNERILHTKKKPNI